MSRLRVGPPARCLWQDRARRVRLWRQGDAELPPRSARSPPQHVASEDEAASLALLVSHVQGRRVRHPSPRQGIVTVGEFSNPARSFLSLRAPVSGGPLLGQGRWFPIPEPSYVALPSRASCNAHNPVVPGIWYA